MTDLQQPPTTLSRLKGNRSRYSLESPPPAAHISHKPEMVGKQFGWVKIISPEKRWNQKWNHCYVLTQCTGCGSVQWQLLNNLTKGISKGCQQCSQPRQIPKWLDRRLTAAKQRCENPNDPQYPNYGARGIKFKFSSILEAGLYLIHTFGIPSRDMELDRIDNNGHYEVGNLRFVTRKMNQANRRISVIPNFNPKEWSYARSVVTRMLSAGMNREEIIQSAQKAVLEKRKNWRTIEEKLKSMTYEMQDSDTVLPYRGGLSTTADTAERQEH